MIRSDVSLTTNLDNYLHSMKVDNYSEETMKQRLHACQKFIAWCQTKKIHSITNITRDHIEAFKGYLHAYKMPSGKSLLVNSQIKVLSHVFQFLRWLAKNRYILYNPAAEVDYPREERHLPRNIFTELEVKRILAVPDTTTEIGIRDRAILEVLYSTGIRRRELTQLTIYDLDETRQTLFIRKGKGRKDRVVPVGKRALKWLNRYLEIRPSFRPKKKTQILFITSYGFPIAADRISYEVAKYIKEAGVEKKGSCHLFRHSMATHMLDHGADVRYVQEILGHAKLETTQVYTHVSIQRLTEVHRQTHPLSK